MRRKPRRTCHQSTGFLAGEIIIVDANRFIVVVPFPSVVEPVPATCEPVRRKHREKPFLPTPFRSLYQYEGFRESRPLSISKIFHVQWWRLVLLCSHWKSVGLRLAHTCTAGKITHLGMTSTQERKIRQTGCDARFDNLTRQLYATDASIYQI